MNRLPQGSGDSQLRLLLSVASPEHGNFHGNRVPREMVEDDVAQVRRFLQKLERFR